METKIDIDSLKSILSDHLDLTKQAEILRDINKTLAEEESIKEKISEEKPPKVEKKAVVILTSLPAGWNPKELEECSGFITEIPLEDPTRGIIQGIEDTRVAYKESKKAKKNPADSLGDLFELAPVRLFKDSGILKKPKGPVEFVYCQNR